MEIAEHKTRLANFIARREAFGLRFGLEHGNYQNGNMVRGGKPSTPADIALWLYELGVKVGLFEHMVNEQGQPLFKFMCSEGKCGVCYNRHLANTDDWRPVPQGVTL